MLGTKIYKTDLSNYTETAIWCNANNATIEDKGAYYEVVPTPTTPNITPTVDFFTQAVQSYMDTKAQERGYDSILSVCSYVDSGVARFDSEGAAARKWRSAVWETCYRILNDIEAGTRGVPTVEELIAELPPLEW